jgi:ribosome biogenesis GTPase
MIRHEKIQPILCWNKEDLAAPADVELLKKIYDSAGIIQVQTCALTGQGVTELRSLLKDRTTVLAGPSGVGKSSLLNQIEPGLTLKTGETSQKLGRGKHTTRHVEWLPLSFGGWVADTPGFSQIYLPENVNRENLRTLYPDFDRAQFACQFSSCSHVKEVQCGVKAAVAAGLIDEGRYQRYVSFMEDLTKRDKRY